MGPEGGRDNAGTGRIVWTRRRRLPSPPRRGGGVWHSHLHHRQPRHHQTHTESGIGTGLIQWSASPNLRHEIKAPSVCFVNYFCANCIKCAPLNVAQSWKGNLFNGRFMHPNPRGIEYQLFLENPGGSVTLKLKKTVYVLIMSILPNKMMLEISPTAAWVSARHGRNQAVIGRTF